LAEQPWTETEIAENYQFQRLLMQATPNAFVTPLLVALNVAYFAFMVVKGVSPWEPTTEAILKWGANYGPFVTHGQAWRMVTAMFIHIGVIHIGMNMWVLWQSGQFVERLFGNFNYFVLYMLSGIGGSLTSIYFKPMTVSAGASGAVFGVYGGLVGFLLMQRHAIPKRNLTSLVTNAGLFLVVNMVFGGMKANIDVTAHLGGFVAGFLLGCALACPLTPLNQSARLTRGLLVLVAGTGLAWGLTNRLPVMDDLQEEAQAVDTLENSNAKLFQDGVAKVDAKQMTGGAFNEIVQQKVLPPWYAERNRVLGLRLPVDQQASANKLAQYMALRGEAWSLAGQGVKANDEALLRQAADKQAQALEVLKAH